MIEYWPSDEQAERIRLMVVALGQHAAGMLSAAMASLEGSDSQAVETILRAGAGTDAIHQAIHADCAHYVAGASPLAKDMRFIVMSLQTATDLEAIADQAVEIALAGAPLSAAEVDWPVPALCNLGALVEQRVRGAVLAFAGSNGPLARQCSCVDDRLETESRHLITAITQMIGERKEQAHVGVRLIMVLQALERIAAQAVNIARWVVFTETGERPRRLRAMTFA